MSAARLAVCCGLVALLAAGCRSGGNQELIERELRFQETELYRLHDEVDALQCQLEAAQRENQSLKKEVATDETGTMPARRTPSRPAPRNLKQALPVPSIELPSDASSGASNSESGQPRSNPGPPPIEPPSVDIELPDSPSSLPTEEPSLPDPAMENLPPPAGASLEEPSGGGAGGQASRGPRQPIVRQTAHEEPVSADQLLAEIVLDERLTGGRDRDGQPGDEALAVAFEPRSSSGKLIRPAGDISIVVLDPAGEGEAARIARWDFAGDKAAKHFGASKLAPGYYFELPWSGRPPEHADLSLFVRIKSPDGSKIIADQMIHVRPMAKRGGHAAKGAGTQRFGGASPVDAQAATEPGALGARFFSLLKLPTGRPPTTAAAAGLPEGAVVEGDESMIGEDQVFAGADAKPQSNRLLDRSRLRGGPGIFDGSRIRSLAGRDPSRAAGKTGPTPAAGGEMIVDGGSAAPVVDGERVIDDPVVDGSVAGDNVVSDRVVSSRVVSSRAAGEHTLAPRTASRIVKPPAPEASEPTLSPAARLDEPAGPPPLEDDAPQEPPAPRYARPVWRPYR